MYHVPVQDNARNMLESQATRLGAFGDDAYYILDGKVWRVSNEVVYRSDNGIESTALHRLCREAGFPGNRQCTGCGTSFGINPTVPAHRRGYCSPKCEQLTD